MDCLSASSPVTRIVLMKGAQIGATEAGNNWIGYVIDQAPGPMLSVLPTVEMAKRTSKQRIAPMIDETPALHGKVREARSRDSGNTVLAKEFTGGVLVMTGANSAVGLRSMPARYIFLDEVDGYPGDVDDEGDPVALAEARARTFRRRKVFLASTPTIESESRIEREFQKSDQRRYFVPCPLCNHLQTLRFEQLRWSKGAPRSARYECEDCHGSLGDEHKTEMLSRGEWRATAEGNGTVGYHLSSLYSPVGWLSWVEIAQRWEAAQGDGHLLKEFINTILGETWKERGDAPDHARLLERIEPALKRGHVPPQALMLTGFADVQMRGIWLEVMAVAPNRETWCIDALYIDGDTSDPANGVFAQLRRETIDRDFPDAFGNRRRIDALGIDAGYRSHVVYSWVRQNQRFHPDTGRELILATQGRDGWGKPAIAQPVLVDIDLAGAKVKQGAKLWGIGTWPLKATVYADLRREIDGENVPDGYCHFGPWCDEVYFRQLTAETLEDVKVHGRIAGRRWARLRRDNHFFDCRVGNLALAEYLGLSSTTAEQWAMLAAVRGVPPQITARPEAATLDAAPAEAQIKMQRREQRQAWINNRGGWLRGH